MPRTPVVAIMPPPLESALMAEEICWVVTDGKPGMVSQALGLAEAVGLPIVEKRVEIRAPWRWLPAQAWAAPFAALSPQGDGLAPPWPRLLIGCGRMSVPLSIAVRRASGGRTFTVQLQDPKVAAHKFDLVVPSRHDRYRGCSSGASQSACPACHRRTVACPNLAFRRIGP